MTIELTEVVMLERHHALTLQELAELSGLPEAELNELVDYGVIVPLEPDPLPRIFHARSIVAARTACRLREDFELDSRGLALALTLLDRVHELEAQVSGLRALLPRRRA